MGVDVPVGNDNYWMWLIPSVGQPPVKSFVLLNALFALIVGPLCYFYFRRRERLYLLYFFAPAMACLVTLGLFAYALSADGVRTQIRSRQITWVDSVSGHHVQLSRQTYYAVMGRERGIQTTDQTAVYPVRYTPVYQYYGRRNVTESEGEIVATEDKRFHRGSFFPARTQTQYLTMDVNEDDGHVSFSLNDAVVTNGLLYRMKQCVIRDESSQWWIARDIDPGAKAMMMKSDRESLEAMLGPEVRPPLGEVPMLRDSYYQVRGMAVAGVQVSSLETRLDQWAMNMPHASFIAIAELDSQRLGVKDATVLGSVHVVMGRLGP